MITGRSCVLEMRNAHSTRSQWGSGCIIKVWFPEWPLFRGKNISEKAISVSAVGSLEVVASRRLAMYFKYGILNRDLKLCPI